VRELGIAERIAGFIEHLSARQLHEFEVRFKGGKVLRLQAGQEPVRAIIGSQNLDHGDRGTPQRQRGRAPSFPAKAHAGNLMMMGLGLLQIQDRQDLGAAMCLQIKAMG
jgi:hypothetical protein